MHIFIINLPEDILRQARIEEQLRSLGLSYELFPAIRGRDLSTLDKSQHYDETWFVRNEGRPALPGEIGCALSHIGVYRLIKERDIPHALILEDDAWLNPNMPQLLQAIEQKYQPEEKDIFLLTWFRSISMRKFETLWASYHLAEIKSAFCTHGYVVSNAAAGALIRALYPVKHVADCWGWLRRHGIVRIRAVFPTCITANVAYESGTTAELAAISNRRPAIEGMAHKAYRGYWLLCDCALAAVRRACKFS